jgi:protein-disulfide isomerase
VRALYPRLMPRIAQLLVVVVLAAVVVVGAVVLSGDGTEPAPSRTSEPGMTAAEEVAALYEGIPQDGVRLGRPDAPATLVEIADLQCPFCAQYSTQVLPSIVDDYVRPGRIAYELRTRSFLGRDSVRAAGAAAEAANEDRMYQFVDLFYRNQGPENSDYADADFMREIAGQVDGLDVESVVAAADDPLSYPAVERNEMFAREIGSTGTPDFYLRRNGKLTPLEVQGTAPEDYAAALDSALARD